MTVVVTRDNGVATVTLNRPDKLNALSAEMYHELADTFAALGADDAVRCSPTITRKASRRFSKSAHRFQTSSVLGANTSSSGITRGVRPCSCE